MKLATVIVALVMLASLCSPTLAQNASGKKGSFFGLETGGEQKGPTADQIAELNKRLAAVTRLVGEGKYEEADAALRQLKADAGPNVKSEGIDNIERIIQDRLAEKRRMEDRPADAPESAPAPSAPVDPFANKKVLDRLLEQEDKARESVNEKPGELSPKQRAAVKEIERLIRAGKHRDAVPLLRDLRTNVASLVAPRHAVVEGLMAELANIEKQHQIALNLASPFTQDRAEYHRDKFNCYLQVGYAHLGLQPPSPDTSLELFNWLAGNENKGDLLRQVLAVEGVGRAFLLKNVLDRSENAFGFALHNLAVLLLKDDYDNLLDKDGRTYLELLKKRLEAQLAARGKSLRTVWITG